MNILRYRVDYKIRGVQMNYSIIGDYGMKKIEVFKIFEETIKKFGFNLDGKMICNKNGVAGSYEILKY